MPHIFSFHISYLLNAYSISPELLNQTYLGIKLFAYLQKGSANDHSFLETASADWGKLSKVAFKSESKLYENKGIFFLLGNTYLVSHIQGKACRRLWCPVVVLLQTLAF